MLFFLISSIYLLAYFYSIKYCMNKYIVLITTFTELYAIINVGNLLFVSFQLKENITIVLIYLLIF